MSGKVFVECDQCHKRQQVEGEYVVTPSGWFDGWIDMRDGSGASSLPRIRGHWCSGKCVLEALAAFRISVERRIEFEGDPNAPNAPKTSKGAWSGGCGSCGRRYEDHPTPGCATYQSVSVPERCPTLTGENTRCDLPRHTSGIKCRPAPLPGAAPAPVPGAGAAPGTGTGSAPAPRMTGTIRVAGGAGGAGGTGGGGAGEPGAVGKPPERRAAMCGCGFVHAPGERCGPF